MCFLEKCRSSSLSPSPRLMLLATLQNIFISILPMWIFQVTNSKEPYPVPLLSWKSFRHSIFPLTRSPVKYPIILVT
uniref:Uncharacterized protein n=1 Tax=Rhizophora mucronata TaxID=61149 RepID=A0A2P2J1E8_RHIMU